MIYCPGYRIGVAHGMLGLVLLQYFCLFGDCLNAGSNSRIASSYLALNSDGGLVGWGEIGSVPTDLDLTSGVKSVSSNPMAFAILKNNGDVVAYGEESNGGSIPSNVDVSNVISITPSGGGNNRHITSKSSRGDGAFCALKSNGEVVTWGAENFGGKAPLGLKNVQRVYSTVGAFVALTRSDPNDPSNLTAVSWGSSYAGGVIPVGTVVSEVVDVFVNPYAYCLLLRNGSISSVGFTGYGGGRSAALRDVISVTGSWYCFAALTKQGQIHTWGNTHNGGEFNV